MPTPDSDSAKNEAPTANPFCKEVRNFCVTRNRLGVACLRVLPQGVFFALAPQNAAVPAKVS